ncbi:hypothetical protein LVJ94_52240 [Pendulispora rubella]|uniref:Uncharacterized protein n=1 Tax=Pendulispora rubella TaxID=2741070 RepID=A0ABZ2L532_9BACT
MRTRRDGPVAGATISSGEIVTTTDTWGRFVLRNVPPKYDLMSTQDGRAQIFHGLTTRRPTIQNHRNDGWFNTTPVHIDYSDATTIGSERITFAVRDDLGTEEIFYGAMGPNTLDSTIFWAGPTSELTGTFLSLEYERPNRYGPPHYLGIATAPMRLLPDQKANFHPIYSPIAKTTTITGVARAAPGTTIYNSYLRLSFGGLYSILDRTHSIYTQPEQFIVPEIAGASWAIEYEAYTTGAPDSSGGARSAMIVPVGADGSVPEVDLPAPPRIISPAEGTTDFGVGSEIVWQGEGACTVSMGDTDYKHSVSFTTLESHLTMPDLSAAGMPLEHGRQYRIFVWCHRRSNRAPSDDPVLDFTDYYLGSPAGTSGYARNFVVTAR